MSPEKVPYCRLYFTILTCYLYRSSIPTLFLHLHHLPIRETMSKPETLIKRQATLHDCLPQLAGRWGANEVKQCPVREKIFCPTIQPRKDLFQMSSMSSHTPQFQQSAGATPLQSLWSRHPNKIIQSCSTILCS